MAGAKKSGNLPLVLGGVVFTFIGASVVVIAVFMLFSTVGIIVNGASAEGTITDIEVSTSTSTDSDGYITTTTSYYPVVSFRARDEQIYTFRSNSSDEDAEVGDKVRVLYKSSNPGDARINSFWHLWGMGLVVFLVGLVFAGVGVLIWGPFRSFMAKHS